MKAWAIVVKDLRLAFTSPFGVLNMFVLPLVITGIIYLAFGGLAGGTQSLPLTQVIVVNQDRGAEGLNAGQMIVDTLRSDDLSALLAVQELTDDAAARTAVVQRSAGVAVIIPSGLSQAVVAPGNSASIELLHDPTLTIGPRIVQQVLQGWADALAGSRIAVGIVTQQLQAGGQPLDQQLVQSVITDYAADVAAQGARSSGGGLLTVTPPPAAPDAATNGSIILASVMVGMMVYYAFFTAANAAQTLIAEEEDHTLQRLQSTPTPVSVLYMGKLGFVLILVIGELTVLHIASALLFGIHWPNLPRLSLLVVSLGLAAGGFSLFAMSFARTRGQAGGILGGVLTAAGMLGGCFTVGVPNMPSIMSQLALVLPHGWALRGWQSLLRGGSLGELLLAAAVMAGMGLVYLGLGTLRFAGRLRGGAKS